MNIILYVWTGFLELNNWREKFPEKKIIKTKWKFFKLYVIKVLINILLKTVIATKCFNLNLELRHKSEKN